MRERAGKGEPPFDRDYWQRAAELGWTAMLVPEEHGGAAGEQPVLDLVIVAEEIGRQIAPGPFLPSATVIDALLRSGSPEQQAEYLPGMADGSTIATWAMAEAPDGWEPAEVTTKANRDGDGYVLSGEKTAVEAGGRRGPVPGHRVDAGRARPVPGAGRRRGRVGPAAAAVRPRPAVRRCHVPGRPRPGQRGDRDAGRRRRRAGAPVPAGADPVSAETTALTEKIFDATIDYMQDRYAFGRPLASYQALKHRIADHKLWLEAGCGLSTALAHALDSEDPDVARLASVTKAHISEQSLKIISDCSQLFGGIALTWEHDLHLYLRRATVNKVLYGSARQHKERLCRLDGL